MSTKMKFTEDKYYNRDVIYVAGKVYDVPDHMVVRWLKRGGEIVVEEEVKPLPSRYLTPLKNLLLAQRTTRILNKYRGTVWLLVSRSYLRGPLSPIR